MKFIYKGVPSLSPYSMPTFLNKEKRMQALDAKEMESSSKIDLKHVSWGMSIKEACRPRAPIIAKLSKEMWISLAIKRKSYCVAHKHD
jgi:hypothetical protein